MYYCTKPTPKIETRYQSAKTQSEQLFTVHPVSQGLRLEQHAVTRRTACSFAVTVSKSESRESLRGNGLPRFIASFHIHLEQTLRVRVRDGSLDDYLGDTPPASQEILAGYAFFPAPLTGWNICFNLFSMFQTIGRKKSQGKGCRHRHKSIMGDPRD
jgi:hypothetical protein